MRNLYEILEGILDDDETVNQRVESDALVLQLVENGIYYACAETKARFKSACENRIASLKDGILCFYNDDVKVASEVVIDYEKAKDFLKRNKIKSIEAPYVTIYNPDEDLSIFGTISTRFLKIFAKWDVYKNLKVIQGRSWDATVIKNSKLLVWRDGYDFCDSRMGIPDSVNTLMIDGFDKYIFQNCDISLHNLTIHGDGVDFKNCKGELMNIEVYDPGLFDGNCGKELFSLFDPNYKYSHYINSNMKKERKTNSIRKILAFFGNKKYFCPDSNPFKVVGKMKDVCDLSGFKNFYSLSYRDNNYDLIVTSDKEVAQHWQNIDKFNYTDNYHKQFPLEQTKDGYYIVIFANK